MIGMRDAMRRVKALGWDKIEEYNQRLDDESVMRYIRRIMEEDHVGYEEAWRLCREEPKYSMGLKMCSPAIVMMLKSEKGRARFREMLTPEELEIFDKEVAGKINFRKAVKQEFKRQRKKKGKEDDGDAVELSGL